MSWSELAAHWPTVATASAGLGAGGLLKTLLDHKRAVRRATDEIAMNLVQQLTHRIESIEASASQERALCDANLAVLRHRVNNLSGSFDGLLLLIEMAPERAREFVTQIKEKRAVQEQAEAAEKAGVAAIALAMAAPKGADL